MIYLKLFLSFLQIGFCSFGGGYVAIPLIQSQIVEKNQWMTMQQLADLITIAEMTPGPIAINCATFVGTQLAGFWGAFVCTLGYITPSCILIGIFIKIYLKYRKLSFMQGILKGLRPAIVGMVASAGFAILLIALFPSGKVSFANDNFQWIEAILFVIGFFLLRKYKINPIAIILGSGVWGAIFSLIP